MKQASYLEFFQYAGRFFVLINLIHTNQRLILIG